MSANCHDCGKYGKDNPDHGERGHHHALRPVVWGPALIKDTQFNKVRVGANIDPEWY